jgi:hypothetical protein
LLKCKNVKAWQFEGMSAGTLKNLLAHLRWWAEKEDKAGVIPANNTRLGIPERLHATNADKSKTRGDAHAQMSLQLQQAFGLQWEESIKFQPGYAAGRGDHIALKRWTFGAVADAGTALLN